MDSQRLQAFETMLASIEKDYSDICGKMEQLKAQGREKSATYRQLMGNKLMYKQMLFLYTLYGIKEPDE